MANLLPPAAFLAKIGNFKPSHEGLVSPEAFKQVKTPENILFDGHNPRYSSPTARKRGSRRVRRGQGESSHQSRDNEAADTESDTHDVDMLQLIKSEINQLKEMQLKGIEHLSKENKPPVSASQSVPYMQPTPHVHNKYLDELIDRQNTEILQLKHLVKEFEMKQSSYVRKSEEQEEIIKAQYQRELNAKQSMITALTDELNSVKIQLEQEKTTQQTVYDENHHLQNQLSSLERTIEEKADSLTKLKTYLQELQSTRTADQLWISEKQKLCSQLDQTTNERENLKSDCRLLNQRIEHLEQILSIQEQSLTKDNQTANGEENSQQNLLTRWRCKVYEMLVQQKSVEISYKKEVYEWKRLKSEMNAKIDKQNSEIAELQTRLKDRNCRIQLNQSCIQNLETQLTELRLELDKYKTENQQSIEDREEILLITRSAQNTLSAEMERMNELYMKKVSLLESRIICSVKVLPKLIDSVSVLKSVKCNLEGQLVSVSEERNQLEETYRRISNQQGVSSQRIKELEEVVSSLTVRCTDSDSRCEKLLTELRTYRDNIDLEKTRIELNVEREFINKLKTAEDKIIELKRQLAKNVVEVRSLERDNSRLKSQHEEDKELAVEKYRQRCDRLELENKNLLTERNIVQANLRYANKPTQKPRIRSGEALNRSHEDRFESEEIGGDISNMYSEPGQHGDDMDSEVLHELTVDELNERRAASQMDEIESLKGFAQSLIDGSGTD